MSISSEINRISGNVSDALDAIADKGVTVPSGATSDDLADLIAQISGGGGGATAVFDEVVTLPGGGDHHIITGVDISGDTVTAPHLELGYTAHDADGNPVVGTLTPGGGSANIQPLSVTQNGTYTASGGVDGYSPVTVNVSGGGGTSVEPKDVNFIDYDGTILYSYTAQEAQALSALPSNPSHDGLTAQGWNWTLQQIKTQLTNVGGVVWVGQMYITSSGKTEIDVDMKPGALEPYLVLAVNGTVTVDWGDNTATDTMTGTSLTTLKYQGHVYASAGKYTIKITVSSGSFTFYSSGSSYPGVLRISNSNTYSRKYADDVLAIRVGSGVTTIGNYAFSNCYSLQSVTIPSTVTSIGNGAFYYCTALTTVTIPSSVTSIDNYAFQHCYTLTTVTIPSTVTSIGSSAFYNCYTLTTVTIPSTVTSIGNDAFYNCYTLTTVTIPSTVTSIGSSAFYNAYSMDEYHFLPATPPTLANTNAFNNIRSYTKIYVPSASLSAYQTETNWSTYATYMVGE